MKKRKFKDGYQNTGIFHRNTKNAETKEKNGQLKEMYCKWIDHINLKLDKSKNHTEYNGIQYLTCFDSYLDSNSKVMIFGREANSNDYKFTERNDYFNGIYQNDLCYSYEYAISHPEESYAKNRAKVRYLQTRKLISGFDDNRPSEKAILSALVNNLNKTSKGGKYTPCCGGIDECDDFDKGIYSEFEFNEITKNVFIHELNILRPTHLVFLCGKGYNNHIKRDFGEEFFKTVKGYIDNLSVTGNPISDQIELEKNEIKYLFDLEDYEKIQLIFALHPCAHMTGEVRDNYEEALRKFIEEDTYEKREY